MICVSLGALSPRTRNAQVALFEAGEVDYLVATDAIGMGLNLDLTHVAFADDRKFDGHQTRPLTPAEFGPIAGRAGRHMRNGSFGVTGNAAELDEELVVRLESHDFEPVRVLQWRNAELDFGSPEALLRSLDAAPGLPTLTRVPVATAQHALEFLNRNEAGRLASGDAAVRLLWQCCGIPDYRDISPAQHGEIVTRIFVDIMREGHVDADWIAEQVRFCDNVTGDIDTLSNRIRQVRTWTYVANRRNWLADPTHWREKTRDIEDRLSDALHERLTQRFVDRRTSVLMRHLRDKHMVSPEVNERGEVSLEGHLIGSIDGLRFTLARSEGGDAKGLHNAASQAIAPEIAQRAATGDLYQLGRYVATDITTAEDTYIQVVRGKTAALFAAATEAGAVIAGAPEDQVNALRDYGDALGIAFQIVDDILDFTGDPEDQTGGAFHPEDWTKASAAWQHSLETGEIYEIEHRLRRHDGEYRWMISRAVPGRDSSGEIVR